MKKRIIALALCILILAGLFCACGKDAEPTPAPTAKQLFATALQSVQNVKEAGYDCDLRAALPASLLDGEEGSVATVTAAVTGTFSQSLKQSSVLISASVKIDAMTASFDCTDILIDGDFFYMDLYKAFSTVLTLLGRNDVFYYDIFDYDYLGADLKALTGSDLWSVASADSAVAANYPKLAALIGRTTPVVDSALKDEYFTAAESLCTFTMNKADAAAFATLILNDVKANSGEYIDAFIELLKNNPELLASIDPDYDAADLDADRDDIVANLAENADDAIAYLACDEFAQSPDFTLTASVSSDPAAKTHTLSMSLKLSNDAELTASMNIAEGAQTKISPPEQYVTVDELAELFSGFSF